MPSAPVKVLIITDEPNLRIYLANLLRSHGCDPTPASHADEGLVKIRSDRPDVVILDAMLPDDEAHHAYYQLKNDPDLGKIPVVLISSIGRRAIGPLLLWPWGSAEKRLPEPEAFLDKPPEADVFLATLDRLLGRTRNRLSTEKSRSIR